MERLKLAPSILDADFARIDRALSLLEGKAQWLHLDIMDGHFVPNLTFGPPVAADIVRLSPVPAEAHLMVEKPSSLVRGFVEAGCKRILVHPEGEAHLHRVLQDIASCSVVPGVVLNPATPICAIEQVLHMVGIVLVMTVNPGFGGQLFIESCLDKVRRLAELRRKKGLQFDIEVDGGVNGETLPRCVRAGADTFVVGSAIFRAESPSLAIDDLARLLASYERRKRDSDE